MQIDESFRLDVPVDQAWRILLDLERVAASVPGAHLDEVVGDECRGTVDVTVGPITARYQGSARFESIDDVTHRAVLVAIGRDTRGEGNASATVQVALIAEGRSTRVDLDTELAITGKVGQFGRDVIGDVSTRLLAELVTNLERDIARRDVVDLTEPEADSDLDAGQPVGEPDDDTPDELVADAVAAAAEPAAAPSGNGAAVRKADPAEIAPIELLEVGGSPVLRRVAPLAGFVLVALALRWLVRRRHR